MVILPVWPGAILSGRVVTEKLESSLKVAAEMAERLSLSSVLNGYI
jgi:hypothetical protein